VNTEPNPPGPFDSGWPARQLWGAILVVFFLQVGLICLLGSRREPSALPRPSAPVVTFARPGAEGLLSLNDPTLFALPHFESFSGDGWMKAPPLKAVSLDWTNAPDFLEIKPSHLGTIPVATNMEAGLSISPGFLAGNAEVSKVAIEDASLLSAPSRVQFSGDLAGCHLQSELRLPPWANEEILNETVLRLVVNPAGEPVSVTLIASSGLSSADQFARDIARTTRFSCPGGAADKSSVGRFGSLRWGEMIFQWQTLPKTNNPTSTVVP
jgi:hypothetical protein